MNQRRPKLMTMKKSGRGDGWKDITNCHGVR
jgi:hypothetical protein